MFFTEEELAANNLISQLETFFFNISELEEATPLTQDIINEQKAILALRKSLGSDEITADTVPEKL